MGKKRKKEKQKKKNEREGKNGRREKGRDQKKIETVCVRNSECKKQ